MLTYSDGLLSVVRGKICFKGINKWCILCKYNIIIIIITTEYIVCINGVYFSFIFAYYRKQRNIAIANKSRVPPLNDEVM